jgi:hypothetical protein
MNNTEPWGGAPQRPDFDPYSQTGPGAPSSIGRWLQWALLLVGVVLVIRVYWVLSKWGEEPTRHVNQARGPAEPVREQHPFIERKEDPSSVAEVKEVEVKERPALQRGSAIPTPAAVDDLAPADLSSARQRELIHLSAEITRQLQAWQAEMDRWRAEVVPLLENEKGKRLTANPAWVKGFRAVYDLPRPDQTRALNIDTLMVDLTRNDIAADGKPLLPEHAAINQLKVLAVEAQEAAESYRKARLQIDVLVKEAEANKASGDKLLSEALAELERTERLEEIATLEQRLQAAKAEAKSKIATVQQEAIRQAGEAEAAKIMAALAEAKSKQAIEDARNKEEQAKQARRAALEKDLPEIRQKLVPFISKGYMQPGATQDERTTEALPMSHAKLIARGALRPTQEGIRSLLSIASNSNDRPRGAFPVVAGGAVEWSLVDMPYVSRAQALLIGHGQAMVESGLLSP